MQDRMNASVTGYAGRTDRGSTWKAREQEGEAREAPVIGNRQNYSQKDVGFEYPKTLHQLRSLLVAGI